MTNSRPGNAGPVSVTDAAISALARHYNVPGAEIVEDLAP